MINGPVSPGPCSGLQHNTRGIKGHAVRFPKKARQGIEQITGYIITSGGICHDTGCLPPGNSCMTRDRRERGNQHAACSSELCVLWNFCLHNNILVMHHHACMTHSGALTLCCEKLNMTDIKCGGYHKSNMCGSVVYMAGLFYFVTLQICVILQFVTYAESDVLCSYPN